MSTPSTESTGVTKPAKETADSLNEILWAKADAELKAIIERHINLKALEDSVAGVHSADAWKHVINLRIKGLGIQNEVWAPALINGANEATFFALRDYYRNRYVAAFIKKISSMQEELESLQAQVS